MDIITATKEALKKGVGIVNGRTKASQLYLLPTNTKECFLAIPFEYTHKSVRKVGARWNPHAEDILADDWELWE